MSFLWNVDFKRVKLISMLDYIIIGDYIYCKGEKFFFFFFFWIVVIEFKSMRPHEGCSYHQAKISIGFLCRQDLNLGPLLDDKRLYQLS